MSHVALSQASQSHCGESFKSGAGFRGPRPEQLVVQIVDLVRHPHESGASFGHSA
jgi:hypothetical protein